MPSQTYLTNYLKGSRHQLNILPYNFSYPKMKICYFEIKSNSAEFINRFRLNSFHKKVKITFIIIHLSGQLFNPSNYEFGFFEELHFIFGRDSEETSLYNGLSHIYHK